MSDIATVRRAGFSEESIPGNKDLFDISVSLSSPFVLNESESQHQHLELLKKRKISNNNHKKCAVL